MELQDNLENLEAQNVRPYAISYDPVETLTEFAGKHGITYPLLSDHDSRVIREFGILNTLVPEDHRWYGVPFPGTYMVDEQGIVFEKTFYADHVARDSIARMTQSICAVRSSASRDPAVREPDVADTPHGTVHEVRTAAYAIRTYLSSDTIRRGQVHTLTVELDVDDSYHVQADPLPEGYIPFRIDVSVPEGVTVGSIGYPEPKPHRIPGLDDELHIYDGSIRFSTSVLFNVRESVSLTVSIQAQACDDHDCLLPETHTFEVSTKWLANP